MVSIEDIPPEIRWEIAAKSSISLAMGYSTAFRQVLDDKVVDKIEESIWAEGGKQVKDIANSIGLPAGNAPEVDETWEIVSNILIPGIEGKVVDSNPDRAVSKITSCPMLNNQREMGLKDGGTCIACRAFSKNAVESLNPNYTQSFISRMCLGDDYCESLVERK
ncbi:MAG: hypothetical protein K8E24_014150 [Methanobacterium paludis]|nr:hypothetical protein [Methanobacterium paludis]